ncbi:hypothetical protein GCM10022226_41720 [Sphaerisporangium flaviroseum]|uniref:Uncharacterized protein n=1 Tax=Sphaerisporangium flaviroseum TaxID=509199 RepID=A0ABP7IEM9_9ACTN
MPDVPDAIEAHAGVLQSDARVLAECAERLRDIGARLAGDGAAPEWLRETVDAHVAACVTAAADLAEAATRLRVHAARPAR